MAHQPGALQQKRGVWGLERLFYRCTLQYEAACSDTFGGSGAGGWWPAAGGLPAWLHHVSAEADPQCAVKDDLVLDVCSCTLISPSHHLFCCFPAVRVTTLEIKPSIVDRRSLAAIGFCVNQDFLALRV